MTALDTAPAFNSLPPLVLTEAAAAAGVEEHTLAIAVDLALSGGPDATAGDWWKWASCRGRETNGYFPERGRPIKGLLGECRENCAVQAECLAAALAGGEHRGVWGGTSGSGRLRLRKVLREAGVLGINGEPAYLSWLEEGADLEPLPAPASSRAVVPWPHQGEAVSAIADAIAEGGRCQISVATAGGKTRIGLWSATAVSAERVVVLVPNLALIAQGIETWRSDECWGQARYLAVCSDAGELDLEATTDTEVVREFLAAPGPAVVFATYQSSPVLASPWIHFDLAVADEAHHLAGEREKAFAAIVRSEIAADRVLYMTSTPRRFARRKTDIDFVSMDDEAFGGRVFELSLNDAVAAGVVADYRVIVAAVERDVFDRVAAHPDLVDVDPHLLAGAIAVVRAMGEYGLSSCLSFHTRVDRARSFSQLIGPVAEALPAVRPPGPGWAGFVHGGASVRIRRRLLDRLADPRTWGVIANAKALGEGVDLSVLDAVAIVDPKNSETDVLQATGRALRRPSGSDKVGTVLLPVLSTGDVDPADPLASIDQRSLGIVSGVLRALRAHDAELGSRLDGTRRSMGRHVMRNESGAELGQMLRKRAARNLLRSRVQLWIPGGATSDLAGAMALQLVRETTAGWDETYGRLAAYAADHGHARPAQSEQISALNGIKWTLGSWCSRQRTFYKRGFLQPDRVRLLESLPGWSWEPRDDSFWRQLDALADYVKVHNGAYPPQFRGERVQTMWHGERVAQFVNEVRTAFKTEGNSHGIGWLHKFPDRLAALEALPGWVWNTKEAEWESSFAKLERYVALMGHADPRVGETVDGFDIARWVSKQRSRIAGTHGAKSTPLTDDRVRRLRALAGWIDHTRLHAWEEGYRILVEHTQRTNAVPAQEHVCDDGFTLGRWIASQRQRWRAGRLSLDRTERLDLIPSWDWKPTKGPKGPIAKYDRQWDAAYERLRAWAEVNGHASPGQSVKNDDGYRLGGWVQKQRCMRQVDRLRQDRIDRLEQLPGWVWQVGRWPSEAAS
jgi:superfamily II DNA or RNA helicase